MDKLCDFLGDFVAKSEGKKRVDDLAKKNPGAKYVPDLVKAAQPAHAVWTIENMEGQWEHDL